MCNKLLRQYPIGLDWNVAVLMKSLKAEKTFQSQSKKKVFILSATSYLSLKIWINILLSVNIGTSI